MILSLQLHNFTITARSNLKDCHIGQEEETTDTERHYKHEAIIKDTQDLKYQSKHVVGKG